MVKVRTGLLALACLGWTGFAHALALGEIEVTSRLNQPLAATISLSGTPAEIDNVEVSVASNEDFERAGLERSEFLSSLRFEVQNKQIRVWSKDLAREPFVSFLLEVRSGSGRLLREYTVLLDPPTLAQSSSARPAPLVTELPAEQEQVRAPAPAATMPPPRAPAAPERQRRPDPARAPASQEPAPVAYQGETYGPVAPRETLWSIAYKLRPDPSLTMDQMQVAIFEANPRAFEDNRITGLMKGVMLRIPSIDEIRAVDPVSAKAQVAAARARGASGGSGASAMAPSRSSEATAPLPETEPAPTAPESEPAPSEPVTEPAPDVAAAPESEPPASVETTPTDEPTQAPAETPASPPPTAAAPPPAETEPAPAPEAESPLDALPGFIGDLVERAKRLADDPMFGPAVVGAVLLLFLLIIANAIRKKLAKWSYERASRKRKGEAAPMYETGEAVPAGPSPTQAALDEAARTPTLVAPRSTAPLAATQAMGAATMQQTMQQTQIPEPRQAATGGGPKLDFDVTGSFANETVQINLDAGDPVSEAEFHRAYGLYDEAALLLKQALQKDPTRTDARVKLAEIYFEASKAGEFVGVARELKEQLPPDEWQKIALLGSQIAPDDALFKGAAGGAGTIDLTFDAPATAAAATPAKAAAAAPASDNSLDFSLDEVQLPDAAPEPAAPAAPAGDSLEFDLGDLKLDTPAEPAPAAPAAASEMQAEDLKLDLGDFDVSTEAAPADAGAIPAAPVESGGELGEMMEFGTEALDDPAAGAGDEVSTKLDLARAYIDMGDSDMAKSLLNEVIKQGNDAQKNEAQELLKRVAA